MSEIDQTKIDMMRERLRDEFERQERENGPAIGRYDRNTGDGYDLMDGDIDMDELALAALKAAEEIMASDD